ncbi:DUF3054 domain containing protein [Nitzschia inconspicua]|uniref:DUF3054 domain containing protein n=1 Tax=Nitzschia inconspicua TaxID=303405 RepID=A0A9K3LY83_9STRA|nr:DUF3054 domain containing protein [Nitzschia inconspicua]
MTFLARSNIRFFAFIILLSCHGISIAFLFPTTIPTSTSRLQHVVPGIPSAGQLSRFQMIHTKSPSPPDLLSLRAEPASRSSSTSEEDATVVPSNPPDPPTSTPASTLLDRPVLAILDFVALMVFAAIGKASHAVGDETTLFQELSGVALTALPFVVSWFATSFVTGVYQTIRISDDTNNNNSNNDWLVSTWKQTAKGWIVAIPLGCVGRGLIKGYVPPIPFVIVTMIATFVILGLTRTAYYFVTVGSNKE